MTAPALQTYIQGQGTVSADNLNSFEQTCDVAQQLRALTGVPGMQVFIRGTFTVGDGGQGNFYWNALGTAPDDGGLTTIVPTGSVVGVWTRLTVQATSSTVGTGAVVTAGTAAPIAPTALFITVKGTSGSPTALSLPAQPQLWERHYIKGAAATVNIVLSGGAFTIDGLATFTLAIGYEAVGVFFNGTEWSVY